MSIEKFFNPWTEPFNIVVVWNQKPINLNVKAFPDEDWGGTLFLVFLENEELGCLYFDLDLDRWRWLKGDLDDERAVLVGSSIIDHKM